MQTWFRTPTEYPRNIKTKGCIFPSKTASNDIVSLFSVLYQLAWCVRVSTNEALPSKRYPVVLRI